MPASPLQGEFEFFIEDAASKLLFVPASGNELAEQAASKLNVPIATLRISESSGLVFDYCRELAMFSKSADTICE